MANITYRINSNPTLPGASTVKGSALTNIEVDANFKALDVQIDNINAELPNKANTADVLAFSIALG